jgi:general secretion pathway protein L
MLNGFVTWWLARIRELLPTSWADAVNRAPDGIVITSQHDGTVSAAIRRRGRPEPVTLGVAARQAVRKPVSLAVPDTMLLEKHHIMPAAPRRELAQMLRHELARITPFSADALFWSWDARTRSGDRSRVNVTLTMVPKAVLASALAALDDIGIKPRFIETGPKDHPRLLPIGDHPTGQVITRGLMWASGGLAVIALLLPVALQELALYQVNTAIDRLQPQIAEVERLRRGIAADGAGGQMLEAELRRTGDLLGVLATVTRILPDDTYLNDFALRDRQIILGGRSAAAAQLIPRLSADPSIRAATFAAPVTRLEGSTTDLFSIRADIAP